MILVEIGVLADEESLLHSSFEPVLLFVDDSVAFPVNPVVADLLTADLDSSYQQPADVGTTSVPQGLETQLLITRAQTISEFEKEIDDDPVHPCCSCERLQQRKCVTRVSLSDNLGSKVWPALKAFIVEQTQASKCCSCVTTSH